MAKKQKQMSDKEFFSPATRARFRAEMKAAESATGPGADTSWIDDLPEGTPFGGRRGETLVIVEGRPTRSRRARAGSLPGTAARTGVRRTGGTKTSPAKLRGR
jgi:hypothetical protein